MNSKNDRLRAKRANKKLLIVKTYGLFVAATPAVVELAVHAVVVVVHKVAEEKFTRSRVDGITVQARLENIAVVVNVDGGDSCELELRDRTQRCC